MEMIRSTTFPIISPLDSWVTFSQMLNTAQAVEKMTMAVITGPLTLNLELAQPFGQIMGSFHVNAQMIATARVVMIRDRFPRMLMDKPEIMHTTAITYRIPRSTTGVLNFGWR